MFEALCQSKNVGYFSDLLGRPSWLAHGQPGSPFAWSLARTNCPHDYGDAILELSRPGSIKIVW